MPARKTVAATREKAMAVRLPTELRQKLKGYCGKTERKIQDVVAEAISLYLRDKRA
jgi:predicted DNA-binding protein